MESLISLENVSFSYVRGKPAVDGVSVDFFPGEFVGIMGSNGSGKTTLAKLMCGMLKPSEGRVLIKGMDTRKLGVSKVSETIGLVFQNPALQIFTSSVGDELRLALVTRGTDGQVIRERVCEVLKLFDLEGYLLKHPHMLSRGEQQRVVIASVVALRPEAVILDEPTTGQDILRRKRMMKSLGELNRLGATIILITHDAELASSCDRLLVMSEGRIVADGTPREVMYDSTVLERAGLRPPQIVRLARRLRDKGVPEGLISVREACEAILRLGAHRESLTL